MNLLKRAAAPVLTLMLLALLMAALTVPASAESSGTCGENLTWTLDDEGTLTISGTGEMSDSYPWRSQRDQIKAVVIEEGVTTIGRDAFNGYTNLASVELPEGLTEIGRYAFSGCTGLTGVIIPEGVTTIGSSAFSDCNNLAYAVIPESVTEIENSAFGWIDSLAWVYYPGDEAAWKKIGNEEHNSALKNAKKHFGDLYSGACGDKLTYRYDPDSATLTIEGSGDMYNYGLNSYGGTVEGQARKAPWVIFAKSITSVSLPDGLTSIGSYAFEGCENLTSISIPDGVITMGRNAFKDCSLLKSAGPADSGSNIEFGWRRTIPANAFFGANCLENVSLPDKLLKIGKLAFNDCVSLQKLVLPEGMELIEHKYERIYEDSIVDGCPLLDSLGGIGSGCAIEIPWEAACLEGLLRGNGNLKRVELPADVTEIGNNMFSGCSGLESFDIPSWVTKIGRRAFANCTSLQEITVPGAVGEINATFAGCTNLKEVRFANGATAIGPEAFKSCTELKTVYIPRSVKTIGENAFFDCEKLYDVYYTGDANDWGTTAISDGNKFLTTADFHYGQSVSGKAKTDIAAVEQTRTEDGKKAVQATDHCETGTKATAVGARYSADGQMLEVVTVELKPGQDTQLEIPAEDGTTIRFFTVDKKTSAPLSPTANLAVKDDQEKQEKTGE